MSTEIYDGDDGENCGYPRVTGPLVSISTPTKKDHHKPDLARILIEGTNAVYGPKKAYRVQKEFDHLRQQPPYRRNAEDLTAVVERICSEPDSRDQPAIVCNSLDDAVELNQTYLNPKPSMLRVAAKGTANLARKAHLHQWYYPLVGFLPAKYQAKIAEKYGDRALHYTISNAVAEGIATSGILSYLCYQDTNKIETTLAWGMIGLLGGIINTVLRAFISVESKENKAAGSIAHLPVQAIMYSIAAVRAIKNGVVDAYSSALEEEQQKLLEAPKRIEQPKRIEEPEITLTPGGEKFVEAEEVEEEIGIRNNFTRL